MYVAAQGHNKTRGARSAARMFADHSRELRLTLGVLAVKSIIQRLPNAIFNAQFLTPGVHVFDSAGNRLSATQIHAPHVVVGQ